MLGAMTVRWLLGCMLGLGVALAADPKPEDARQLALDAWKAGKRDEAVALVVEEAMAVSVAVADDVFVDASEGVAAQDTLPDGVTSLLAEAAEGVAVNEAMSLGAHGDRHRR